MLPVTTVKSSATNRTNWITISTLRLSSSRTTACVEDQDNIGLTNITFIEIGLLTTNICLFLPFPCSLNTVTLLWTLYYIKHRNWFHESLVMLEIFTKLPLKIQKFWFLYRQAVRNSLKNFVFLVLTIFRASSRFVFQVTTFIMIVKVIGR